MGRTGRFLASEHWGVEPDLVLLAKALSGGFVPVGAVACRREVFDRVFDRMDRALVHGSTFAKNDLAMAAGLATLTALEDERLIARSAALGGSMVDSLRQSLAPFDLVKEVRGKGMMIALQLGPPRDLRLKAAYALMDRASKGLFCQLILIQLLRNHRVLAQVAGHDLPVIKLLPPLVLSEPDVEWMLHAFTAVIGDSQSLASLASLGRELAGHALRTRADAA
jgi:ornithine--oxo-acid transaminase